MDAVSGLKCNLDKTFVVPVGSFAKETMCRDLNLKWVDSFTVLGITIDNKLKHLQDNFQTIYAKDDKKLTDKIQTQINLFVYQNKVGVKNHQNNKSWVPEDIYHGGKQIGGFRMIRISDFFQSLRLSWVRRYTFGNGSPLNDHWC